MWNNKNKALTFSFDDGVVQDIRLIEIFNKYGVKATFNLNSGRLGVVSKTAIVNGKKVVTNGVVCPQDVKQIYAGHEVAVHTLVHPALCELNDNSVVYQVETDRKLLSELCGYEVVGMAYPGGPPNNDKRIQNIIKERTGIKYARSYPSTHTFDLPNNLYEVESSVYFQNPEKMFELGEKFLKLKTDEPKLFYVWGHSYELDQDKISWTCFEEFIKMMANKTDIFYGTNKEVLL